MKQILLALSLLGFTNYSADAQTSKYDVNYTICRHNGEYKPCGADMLQANDCKAKDRNNNEAKAVKNLRKMDTYVHMGYTSEPKYYTRKFDVGTMHVTYDDPNGAYEGKETMINDGVQKNIHRNMNFLDGAVDVPPVDGAK